jgi:hypothetical protein
MRLIGNPFCLTKREGSSTFPILDLVKTQAQAVRQVRLAQSRTLPYPAQDSGLECDVHLLDRSNSFLTLVKFIQPAKLDPCSVVAASSLFAS